LSDSEKLKLLIDFEKTVAYERDIEKLLWKMADFARDIVDADRCSIWIYDERRDELWTKVAHEIDRIRIPATKGVAGYTALSKEIQIVIDAYDDFRFNPDIDRVTGYLTRTILSIPLVDHNNKTIGVFQALNKKKGIFTFHDAEMMLFISNYASATIENAILYERLKKNQLKLIDKLSGAAEFKDVETSNHTKRVGEIAALLAHGAGLSENEVEEIRATAPMHDIGKIGIPDHILLKRGPLTPEEFETIKRHTIIGHQLLRDEEDDFLHTAAIIALEHHEHFDGSGYPYGKRGSDISLEGRIVAIADVFDALTSKRPYKEAWSLEEAFRYIAEHAGTHFDPELTELFLTHREDVERIKYCLEDDEF
jgi:HD-GYP domain-containing protein (c-di-GMP phosphodiesterase class II)